MLCILFIQVMVDNLGQNKGYGFVAFSSPEEATRAVSGAIITFIVKW